MANNEIWRQVVVAGAMTAATLSVAACAEAAPADRTAVIRIDDGAVMPQSVSQNAEKTTAALDCKDINIEYAVVDRLTENLGPARQQAERKRLRTAERIACRALQNQAELAQASYENSDTILSHAVVNTTKHKAGKTAVLTTVMRDLPGSESTTVYALKADGTINYDVPLRASLRATELTPHVHDHPDGDQTFTYTVAKPERLNDVSITYDYEHNRIDLFAENNFDNYPDADSSQMVAGNAQLTLEAVHDIEHGMLVNAEQLNGSPAANVVVH